jgi:hypothetical protein
MAEPILVFNENKNSTILKNLSQVPYTVRHVKQIEENYPNNFKSITEIQADNSTGTPPSVDQKYKFQLCEAGFLRNLVIKTTLSCSDAQADNSNMIERLGVRLYSNIELVQNGRVIFTNNPSYILNRISDSEYQKQSNYLRIVEATDWTGTTAVDVYTPLFSWIFDTQENNILLDFHKDLEIILTVNSITYDSAINYFNPTLICFRTCYEDDFVHSYIRQNYYTNTTNYLTYDIRTLKTPLISATSSASMFIQVPCLVSCIHCAVINSDYTSTNIKKVTLKLGQRVIMQTDKLMNLLNTDLLAGDNGQNEVSVYLGNKNRKGHSGSIDMSGQAFELIIDYVPLTQDATLWVNLEYLQILKAYQDNGKFSSGLIH